MKRILSLLSGVVFLAVCSVSHVDAALVNPTVSNLVCSGNVVCSTGPSPTVAVTAGPIFSNVTDSALISQRCTRSGGSGILASSDQECPISTTTSSFTIPALGSTVSVGVNTTNAVAKNNTPVTVNDGTNSMNGIVTSGAGAGSYTVRNIGMIAGAVGNTMASSAVLNVANENVDFNEQAGTRLNGIHVESNPSLAVGSATTATFTYQAAYTTAPTCVVGTVGALAPTMSLNAAPGASSAVIFNSATAGNASIACWGW